MNATRLPKGKRRAVAPFGHQSCNVKSFVAPSSSMQGVLGVLGKPPKPVYIYCNPNPVNPVHPVKKGGVIETESSAIELLLFCPGWVASTIKQILKRQEERLR